MAHNLFRVILFEAVDRIPQGAGGVNPRSLPLFLGPKELQLETFSTRNKRAKYRNAVQNIKKVPEIDRNPFII
ncbi:MAG: hypothetical protein P4K94_05090 [Terracidiphilus sp.]|nr:hypothetical protein [Terracidiphilus sp.]